MNKRINVMALVAVLLLPLSQDIFAKGGGARLSFSSPRSSFSKPSSSGGFFKSPSPPSAPSVRYTPPPVVKTTPAPSASVSKPAEKKDFFPKAQAQSVPGYDKKVIEAQKHVDSAKAYKEAKAVKSTPQAQASPSKQSSSVKQEKKAPVYDIASARTVRERRVAELSSRMTSGRYREREVRSNAVYGNSLSGQSVPTYYGGGYNDSYSNPYFWYWLTHKNDQSERERFIYNHQSEMDPRRLQELQTAYPDLTSKFEAIKQEGKLPDPSYVPVGLSGNEDLMYGDDVVHQAKEKASEISSGDFLWMALVMAILCASFWYVLFGKKWKVREYHV